jgi:hypothetical protein
VVDFLLLAADAEVKAGAGEWFAFSIIVSLGLFICWHLFYDSDVPPSDHDCHDTNPDHEVWV